MLDPSLTMLQHQSGHHCITVRCTCIIKDAGGLTRVWNEAKPALTEYGYISVQALFLANTRAIIEQKMSSHHTSIEGIEALVYIQEK